MDTTITSPVDFDLMSFEDVQSADVRIKAPDTGAPTPLVISLAGPEHPKRRKIQLDRQRRLRAQLQRTGKVQLGDPVEDEQEEAELLADCTLGWTGMVASGKVVEFSRAKALEIYTDPRRQWLRAQVKAALDDREAFIRRSVAA